MTLDPKKIFVKYSEKELDKRTTLNLLGSIIDNSEDQKQRLESIEILNEIGINDKYIFQIVENLLISESDFEIRKIALDLVLNNYPKKILKLIKWILKNETSYNFLIVLIKNLERIGSEESKKLLIEELKKIKRIKSLNEEKRYENIKFTKILKELFKISKIDNLTHKQISEIITNFLTIKNLSNKFPNVFFELNPQTALVEELELSDYLEYEVKGTPWGWKNNISTISEIEGLQNLNAIKKLDISNNQIHDIKDLSCLKSLSHIILSNNKIKDQDNLLLLNDLPNLKCLDICGNEVIKYLELSKFNPKIQIISKRYLEEAEAIFEERLK